MSIYSSKRLAKNTLFMYVRMGVSMIVGFITTRVILNVLGVDDYGLYGVVSGVVVLFSFVSSALSTASQRYFSYELGRQNYNRLKDIFNSTIRIYLAVAIIVIVFAETIGLWFLNVKMSFPDGKLALANYVYQISLLITIIDIFRVPFNAAIVSTEKFSFYAYSSLIESFIKLSIVVILLIDPHNAAYKYILYLLINSTFMLAWYILYCLKNIPFVRLSKQYDKTINRELFTFSGWGFFGALCNMGYRQGVNIVINLFFGVVYNAAFGIANQVSSLVNQFVSGFQVAYNPQITKTCASGSPTEQLRIVSTSSKISFSLILLIGIVAILNTDLLLGLWLGSFPEHTKPLCILMIVAAIVDSISDPFWIVIFATGKIKLYQLSCAILMVLNIFATVLCFKLEFPIETCMVVRIIMNCGILALRLYICNKQTSIPIMVFIKHVLFMDITAICIITPIIIVANTLFSGYTKLLIGTPLVLLISAVVLLFILFNRSERTSIYRIVKTRLNK